jgi:hypothetical protein
MGKKKIFLYTLALTATLLIIVFSTLMLIKNNTFKTYGSMDIGFPSKSYRKSPDYKRWREYLETKKIHTIELTGDSKTDNELLLKFQLDVRNLVKTNDSILCLHLKLNKKTKYEDLIRIFDVCAIEDAKIYDLNGYDFLVTNPSTEHYRKKHPYKIKPAVNSGFMKCR